MQTRKRIVLSGTFNPFSHTHLQSLIAARELAEEVVVYLYPEEVLGTAGAESDSIRALLSELGLADAVYGSSDSFASVVHPETTVAVCEVDALSDADRMCCVQQQIRLVDASTLTTTQGIRSWAAPHVASVFSSDVRPWGDMDVHKTKKNFWVKTIRVSPGHRLSLQSHALRTEIWLGTSGSVSAEIDGVQTTLRPGDMVTIPVGVKHRLSSDTGGSIIEFAVGPDVREDDIIRYEDDYKRI